MLCPIEIIICLPYVLLFDAFAPIGQFKIFYINIEGWEARVGWYDNTAASYQKSKNFVL